MDIYNGIAVSQDIEMPVVSAGRMNVCEVVPEKGPYGVLIY